MAAIIYRLAIGLYALAVRIASLFNKKAGLFVAGRKGLLEKIRYALIDERRPRIWMHCASLGEFEQGRPVLERLKKDNPGSAIVLTFFSPSGYEIRKEYKGADYVFYLPLDTRGNAKKFIALVQPQLCIFVKYDLWYFLLKEIESKNITAILISAIFRKEQVFFKWYGGLHRRMLYCFSKIFVQDEASEHLLQSIGIDDAVVAGDSRFDRVVKAVSSERQDSAVNVIIDVFTKDHKILVAGSTWPEDEKFLKTVLDKLSADWKMIMVPHEVDDAHIQQLKSVFGENAVTWSAWPSANLVAEARVLIIDRIGMLLELYQYGNIAWIGGGFGKGIHNTLEAAVYGLPVGFGPAYEKFREAKELIACGGAFSTSAPAHLVNMIANWDKDASALQQAGTAARQYVLSNAGATQKIIAYLSEKKVLSVS